MKLKMKLMAAALAVGFAGAAHAAIATNTHNLGILNPTPVTNTVLLGVGSFSDILNFTVADPYTAVGIAVMNVPVNFFWGGVTISWLDIPDLTASLFAGHGATGVPFAYMGSGDYISASGNVPGGDYSVRLTGTATGALGGMYTYTALAAVPEPGAYAMFLAGLGLVGFMARRRRKV